MLLSFLLSSPQFIQTLRGGDTGVLRITKDDRVTLFTTSRGFSGVSAVCCVARCSCPQPCRWLALPLPGPAVASLVTSAAPTPSQPSRACRPQD